MTEADIVRIIREQGLAPYINDRCVVGDGNGKEAHYLYAYAIEGRGKRRKRHALGSVSVLLKVSEADLVALITSKIAKQVQGAAQKGKE